MSISSISSTTATTSASTTSSSSSSSLDTDDFLALLVEQLQNQDPLSPMDNAQLTTQIAQINTVTGIDKLNTSVGGLSGQFAQMQALQGTSLVGRDVVVPGNVLDIANGVGQGGFELSAPADNVKVEMLSPSGQVVDTMNLGAQGSGMQGFDWPTSTATNASGLTFRVTATSGSIKSSPTTLMRDHVNAITTTGNALNLELQNGGLVPYSTVRAVN